MTKTRAYSYVRFSTPEQSRGDSYRRQTELSRQFVQDHRLELDETLTFQDLGVSAFTGRNIDGGALGAFVQAVDEGRIRRGSYLLVESLDRLSRDQVHKAFLQFTSLLEKGIVIATLQDGKVYHPETFSNNFGDLMVSLSVMYRAHEESLTKSKRLKAAWAMKRQDVYGGGKKLTARAPAWLKLAEDRRSFNILDDRAEVIRRIFSLTLEGIGAGKIASIFNEERVPTFGRSQGWQESYIKKILSNESVTGEFQPMRKERTDGGYVRLPDGDPIPNYFPAVIDRETFLKAKMMRISKRIEGGKRGERFSNLFTGLAKCGVCGGAMHFINKGKGEHYLTCSNARRKVGNCAAPSWQHRPVEAFILSMLQEVDYRELFPSVYQATTDTIKRLDADLLVKEEDLRRIVEQIDNVVSLLVCRPDSPALIAKLDNLEQERAYMEQEVSALRQRVDQERDRLESLQHDHGETKDALERLREVQRHGDDNEAFRLRSRLHQLLKRTLRSLTFRHISYRETEWEWDAENTPVPEDHFFMFVPETPETEGKDWHGMIEIEFISVQGIQRHLWLEAGQKAAWGFKVVSGELVPGSVRSYGLEDGGTVQEAACEVA
ncbi:MAG: recombinase family protein [Alphaproteobacteria bacterium]|nr:recombinase family protein [Alphaproteobacteria bacterium]